MEDFFNVQVNTTGHKTKKKKKRMIKKMVGVCSQTKIGILGLVRNQLLPLFFIQNDLKFGNGKQ